MVPDWAGYCAWRDDFAAVLDQRYYPIGWLDLRVLDGTARMFRSGEAALIVELRDYPGGARDVHVLIAAGKAEEIVTELRPQAEEWGRSNGCIGAVVESREGWKQALKAFGYQPHQLTLRKEL